MANLPQTPLFMGGLRGYFPMPAISPKMPQFSPILGVSCRVIPQGAKYSLESPKNGLKIACFWGFFGVWGYMGVGARWGLEIALFMLSIDISTRILSLNQSSTI